MKKCSRPASYAAFIIVAYLLIVGTPLVAGNISPSTFGAYSSRDLSPPTATVANHPYVRAAVAEELDVAISDLTVSCLFDATTGRSTFTLDLTITTMLAPAGEDLELTFDGSPLTTVTPDASGTTVLTGIAPAAGPGSGLVLTAGFASETDCIGAATVDLIACTPGCGEGADEIGGNVFLDINDDGAGAGAGEVGQSNVLVRAYDCDGALACEVFTNADGDWTCGGLTPGEEYRVEFSTPLQSYLEPALAGADNGTAVQFTQPGTCGLDYGLVSPADYCGTLSPFVITPCYQSGDPLAGGSAGTSDVFVSLQYNDRGDSQTPNSVALGSQMGSVYGVASDRENNFAYTSAFVKRHVGLGPLGEGGIYRIDFSDQDNPVVIPWVDVNTIGISTGRVGTGATPSARNMSRGLPAGTGDLGATGDQEGFAAVAKVGMGDMEITQDGSTLWVVSPNDKTLNAILTDADGDPDTPPVAADVTSFDVPDPCGEGTSWPFATKLYRGDVYVGLVCENALEAYVYRLNGTTFTPVLIDGQAALPLDYEKGFAGRGNFDCRINNTGWFTWVDVPPDDALCSTDDFDGIETNSYIYPTPILSDIEFDVDGSMILGFLDRSSHQYGAFNTDYFEAGRLENYTAGGDILRVCNVGGNFVLQGGAGCANNAANNPLPGGEGDVGGPNGGEYYWQDYFDLEFDFGDGPVREVQHGETSLGALAILPGSGEVAVTAYDPFNTGLFWGGINYFDNTTGQARDPGYVVFKGGSFGSSNGTFGKAAGLGDLELLCNVPPVQIGNYAWVDANGDGVQQACEEPLPNLPVALYDAAGNLVANTLTDAGGEYYFDSRDSEDPNLTWVGTGADTMVNRDSTYVVVFGTDGATPVYDTEEGELPLDGEIYTLTRAGTGQGDNPTANDSDPAADDAPGQPWGGLPFVTVTPAATNHTYDAGFVPVGALTLGSTVFTDTDNNGAQDGADAGIAGVEVQLWNATTDTQIMTGPDGIIGTADDADATPVVTDAEGNYLFAELTDGDYYVVLPIAPASAPISSNNTGVPFVETDPDDDLDEDDDGLQPGGSGTVVTSGTITLVTAEEPLDEPGQGGGQDTLSGLGYSDESGNMTLDFGFFAPVSIGDRAFLDLDANGLQDDDDPGLAGVTATVFNADGTRVTQTADGMPYPGGGMTTTDADGLYAFDDLPPGDYYVVFDVSTAPESEFYAPTIPRVGTDDTVDSDADAEGRTDNSGALLSGDNFPDLDAGFICAIAVTVPEPASICAAGEIDLVAGVVITPDTSATFGATWTTPDGTGDFLDGAGNVLSAPYRFGTAVAYRPAPTDAGRGEVTLTLTTDAPPAPVACPPASVSVTVIVSAVDCGEFFWDGEGG